MVNEAPLLQIRNLTKYFSDEGTNSWFARQALGRRAQAVKAVDGVSFDLHENEIMGVVGESGCGKSTLGRTITQLLKPTSGSIRFRGQELTELADSEIRELRQDIQIIFQDPTSALNPRMKIGKLLREPLTNFEAYRNGNMDDRIDELLEQVNLPLSFKDRYPHELSGGQAQRVGIARALSLEPDLLVADEPVTGLDVSIQAKIINLLQDIQKKERISLLFIAHDLTLIRHISDRVMVLYLGHPVEIGETDSVFNQPQHPYTAALKEAIPKSHPSDEGISHKLPEGQPPSPQNPPSGCPFHPRCPAYIGNICEKEYPDPISQVDGRQVACHHFEDGNQLMNIQDEFL